jgi:hypothetical protein
VDYDMWLGPAPERTFNPNRFHYNWHWHWDYGCGDIGNQGVHQMDIARWGLGKGLPVRVMSLGGRFGYKDQAETPNTQIAALEYEDGQQIIFEVRGLATDKYMGQGIGNLFHGEKGYLSGTKPYDADGKGTSLKSVEIRSLPGGGNHFRNFIEAVKSGKQEDLAADVLEGHLSSALCHLGNISYRMGEPHPINSKKKPFGDNEAANESFERMKKHLEDNGVSLDTPMQVGPWLKFDPEKETFPDNDKACKLLTREYRHPYIVPEQP